MIEIAGALFSAVGAVNTLRQAIKDLTSFEQSDLPVDAEFVGLAIGQGYLAGTESDYVWSNEDRVASRELKGTHETVLLVMEDKRKRMRIVRGRPEDLLVLMTKVKKDG
jgi:hypothetical protein